MLKLELTSPLPRDKRALTNGMLLDWDVNAQIAHINVSHSVAELPSLFAGLDCRAIAPGQFYLVGELPDMTDPSVTLTDQSHGTVLLRLKGEKCEDVLSSLSGADLTVAAFERRPSIQTRLGHISVNLTRADSEVSIIVPRSFVVSVWDDIEEAMHIFG